jgi:site-specific recombinase XerD
MHDRLIGALETCCRRGEMLLIQSRHVDWERHQIAIPGRHACRLLAEHVDIRTIQLMLGHADIKQTQRYLNITDEELRKAMTGMWERRRQLKAVGQSG